jgi:hypothetical protein
MSLRGFKDKDRSDCVASKLMVGAFETRASFDVKKFGALRRNYFAAQKIVVRAL